MSKTGETHYPHARWQTLPLTAVSLTGGFWSRRQENNRRISLQHGYRMLERAGNFNNLRRAAGRLDSPYQGRVFFLDSDVYKWLEAMSYQLHTHPDAQLQRQADEVIDLLAAAQQSDGYLNSYYQVVEGGKRWTDLDFGHELYCAGHLFQAAAAHYRATRTTRLLDVATRFADLIDATFGPDKRQGTCGHPEVEMALVELYRVTGRQAYLDLAKFFIDQRGQGLMRGMGWMGPEYHQDRVPVREAFAVEGHAVRAMYLNAGVADLYLETGEPALLNALDHQWHDLVSHKLFLTGGVGSRYEGEAFGDPYELPADVCYCETCASIGSVMWNWRMLLLTGEGRFADLIERTLYNGILSGVAFDAEHFFYMNPLLSRGGYARREWQEVACCPPNVMRLLASLSQYVATRDATGVQIHLYNTATLKTELLSGHPVALSLETDYPWQGQVNLVVQETDGVTWQLRLRVPEWCSDVKATLNGQALASPRVESGYLLLERAWRPGDVVGLTFNVAPYLVEVHPQVDAVRGSVAIQRGPMVYCLEAVDQPDVNLMDVQLDESAPLQTAWREDLLPEGVMVVNSTGYVHAGEDWDGRLYRRWGNSHHLTRQPVSLTAVPYYAWANRGANAMRVWIPRGKNS